MLKKVFNLYYWYQFKKWLRKRLKKYPIQISVGIGFFIGFTLSWSIIPRPKWLPNPVKTIFKPIGWFVNLLLLKDERYKKDSTKKPEIYRKIQQAQSGKTTLLINKNRQPVAKPLKFKNK